MCSSMLTAVLVVQLCINPSWAIRASTEQEVLDAQSLLAVENSTALLGVNQILEAPGFVLKKSLDTILKLVLSPEKPLVLKGEEQEEGCKEKKTCPFTGTVTIQHDGVTVGCVEHSSRLSSDTFYATGVILKLKVDLQKLEVAGVKVDGNATAVANMPHITLQIRCDRSGCKAHMATMAAATWSLELTCFKNRAGAVGAVLEALTSFMKASRKALGNWLLGLLKQKIIDAIQDNVEVYTDNVAAQATKTLTNVVTNVVTFGNHKVAEEKKCEVGLEEETDTEEKECEDGL